LSGRSEFSVKGFLETSFIDWKESLASVVFCGGCNFRCPFCHNKDLVLRPKSLPTIPMEHILGRLRKVEKWIERVVITGGEPTIHKDLFATVERLKEKGLKVKLDTNGSRPKVVKELIRQDLIDYIAMDVKGPFRSYEKWCGTKVDNGKIKESVELILEGKKDYEFRMTFVPFLHHECDVYETAEQVKGARRFFIQEFIPRDTLDPRLAAIRPLSPDKMKTIRQNVNTILQHASIYNHLQ
jgi:pyruvate formate lyase activating enzyme